jgi:error-prone DNA polymerase
MSDGPAYAELMALSNFSFLRGASHPRELVDRALDLGLAGLGVCDRNTLAGVVRAHTRAKAKSLPFRVGSRLDFSDGRPSVLCYPVDREAYGRLTRLLTLGKTRAKKGACDLRWPDLLAHARGQVLILVPPVDLDEAFERDLAALAGDFGGSVYLAGSRPYGARDLHRLHRLDDLARRHAAPLVAVGDVLYHRPERRPLQDVLSCVREKTTVAQAGHRLEANAERHIKPPAEMARLFRDHPDGLARTIEIFDRCRFSLDELRYEYPHEPVPPGKTAMQHLRDLCEAGARMRYPDGVPAESTALLEQEFTLIEELNYPHYFLTVHDAVRYARSQNILCQGRGSAANSMVCFCLGVTAIDPAKEKLLFARFLSKERDEPPDIDVDFEHERREEVIQEIYRRYGRDRAAICATVIRYRPRSAIRDVGKAMGLSTDITARLADTVWGSWGDGLPDDHIRQAGLDPTNPEIRRAAMLATELLGFPRHLSQHVGGFVLTERRLDETVPIGNAAMEDRTFIEWDKDDIEDLKMMKVDVLALGMLTCLRRGFDMLSADGLPVNDIADIPAEDPAVYDMLCQADSIGVFQIESRAQMSMLPRLEPRQFYDLVIEVAIVRPGPIQGDMVHPYLRRRDGIDPVVFDKPSPEFGPPNELEDVLGRTLGVPLFQEQAMKLAIVAAGFTPDEANGLRRAMATFKHDGDVSVYRNQFVGGMVRRGYAADFAARCFRQIEGFGSYGFPESHAASFAKLVYASAWIKKHRPDVFCAAILNSQPMGFYQPAQLVRDAREHGVDVRPVDVLHSRWDCALEEDGEFVAPDPAHPCGRWRPVRLGFRQVRGLAEKDIDHLVVARDGGARSPEALAAAGVPERTLTLLAQADAFRSVGLDRRAALWAVKGLDFQTPAPAEATSDAPLLALMGPRPETAASLPAMRLPAQVAEDYSTAGLSLKAHPCRFFRKSLAARGARPAEALKDRRLKSGRELAIAGLVLIRQRPGTAKGVVFITLEDETGPANVVVWPDRFEANRKTVMTASFLLVRGRLQRDAKGGVVHLVAESFEDLSPALQLLRERKSAASRPQPAAAPPGLVRSRDFH